jgi:hypothetical protein
MQRLIIHQPKNFESRYYRYYNYFFDSLVDEIKKTNDVIDSRYFKYANSKWYPTLLQCQDTFFDSTGVHMLECEMIIENYDTKGVKVLSVSDDLSSATLSLKENPLCNKILIAQFDRSKISSHVHDQKNMYKYSPWVYFPTNNYDFDTLYSMRQDKKHLESKFYFRGTSIECRRIVLGFNKELFTGYTPIGGFDAYSNELLNHKVGFSIAGRGEFCYRDIEYMAMGIPFIRFEYKSEMAVPLVPNYHYISVPRPENAPHDRDLVQEHAHLIEKRFLEVVNDTEYLSFIANNARNYYNSYIKIDNCVAHTINLLEMNKWQ